MRMPSRVRLGALAALAAVTLVLGGCGGADEPTANAGSSSTGASDPGVVVALDDFAALHAISLGVQPDLVFDVFEYQTSKAIWSEFKVRTEPYGAELSVEKVLAAGPDVIIGSSLPSNTAQKDKLEKIAKTLIVDYTSDWKSQLTQIGDVLGRRAVADRVIGRIATDLAALKRDLGASPFNGAVVSVLSHTQVIFSVPEKSGLGSLLRDAGLDRPAAQKATPAATAPFVDVSPENLTGHDGKAIFLMSGGAYNVQPIKNSPLWQRLQAVQSGKVYEVSAELWFGSSPFAVDWILDDVRAALLDNAKPAASDQAGSRLREFVKTIES